MEVGTRIPVVLTRKEKLMGATTFIGIIAFVAVIVFVVFVFFALHITQRDQGEKNETIDNENEKNIHHHNPFFPYWF